MLQFYAADPFPFLTQTGPILQIKNVSHIAALVMRELVSHLFQTVSGPGSSFHASRGVD